MNNVKETKIKTPVINKTVLKRKTKQRRTSNLKQRKPNKVSRYSLKNKNETNMTYNKMIKTNSTTAYVRAD